MNRTPPEWAPLIRLAADPSPRAADYAELLYVLDNGRHHLITPGGPRPARPGGRRPDLVITDDPPRGLPVAAPTAAALAELLARPRKGPALWPSKPRPAVAAWPRTGAHAALEQRAAAVLEDIAAGRVR